MAGDQVEPRRPRSSRQSRDWVAILLAVGIATALNMVTLAVLINAATGTANSGGISENGTQVLTGWGGGIIGILGAVFGYRAGRDSQATPGDTYPASATIEEIEEP